jgi:voltage-gated potassium channel
VVCFTFGNGACKDVCCHGNMFALFNSVIQERKKESRAVSVFVGLLVVFSIVSMIVATVDEIFVANEDMFFAFEIATVALFGLEYVIRLWVCVEDEKYQGRNCCVGRLKWVFSFSALIDLVATLPFIVLLIFNADFIHGLGAFSALRVLRVVRLLKIDRFTKASHLLKGIVVRNAELLFIVFLFELTLYVVIMFN